MFIFNNARSVLLADVLFKKELMRSDKITFADTVMAVIYFITRLIYEIFNGVCYPVTGSQLFTENKIAGILQSRCSYF